MPNEYDAVPVNSCRRTWGTWGTTKENELLFDDPGNEKVMACDGWAVKTPAKATPRATLPMNIRLVNDIGV